MLSALHVLLCGHAQAPLIRVAHYRSERMCAGVVVRHGSKLLALVAFEHGEKCKRLLAAMAEVTLELFAIACKCGGVCVSGICDRAR